MVAVLHDASKYISDTRGNALQERVADNSKGLQQCDEGWPALAMHASAAREQLHWVYGPQGCRARQQPTCNQCICEVQHQRGCKHMDGDSSAAPRTCQAQTPADKEVLHVVLIEYMSMV